MSTETLTGGNPSSAGDGEALKSIADELDAAFGDSFESRKEDPGSTESPVQNTGEVDGQKTQSTTGEPVDVKKPDEGQKLEESSDTKPAVPPEHWTVDDKKAFGELPPHLQQRWLERERQIESGLNRRFKELASVRRENEELREIFKPYARDMELAGVSMTQAVKQLVAAHNFMQEDPIKGLKWMAQNYGVDIEKLPELVRASGAQSDPRVEQLEKELREMREILGQQNQASMEERRRESLNAVHRFADAKDESGNLIHPFFDDVAEDVAVIMQAGERDLEKAYDRACWSNPTIRVKMQERLRNQEAAAQAKKLAEEAERAKLAGFSVESTVSSLPPGHKTLHEELASGFEQMGLR